MMCSGSVYFQFVQIPHKETPFLSCTIRVQSGRNRKTSSQDAMQAMKTAHLRQKPGGAAPLKKHCPLLMRGNSQGGGQTTNHLLTAANVWEFSYTASAAFSSFPRRWLFLFGYGSNLSVSLRSPASGLNLSVSLRSPAPLVGEPLAKLSTLAGARFTSSGSPLAAVVVVALVGEPLAFRCVCIVTQ